MRIIYVMGKRLTQEEFENRIAGKFLALEPYHNYETQISVQCLTCKHEWRTRAANLAKGYGCPECGKVKTAKTKKRYIKQEYFLSKIPSELFKKIEVKSEYKQQYCEIEVVCKVCGKEWISTPHNLYHGQGCVDCGHRVKGIKCRKSHGQFVKEVFDVYGDSVEVIGRYTTSFSPVQVKCTQCGHIWNAKRLLQRGCPKCCESKGEKRIENILKEGNVDYKREFGFDDLRSEIGGKLRFDFAIFQNNKLSQLIEYDGIHHYMPLRHIGGEERYKKQIKNDALKNAYCAANGIKLVRIPYYKYNKISLKDLLA